VCRDRACPCPNPKRTAIPPTAGSLQLRDGGKKIRRGSQIVDKKAFRLTLRLRRGYLPSPAADLLANFSGSRSEEDKKQRIFPDALNILSGTPAR
jgi:hypothetical protein